ncbi:MAG: glycosyltransferase [Saprospiraceae bacterium]
MSHTSALIIPIYNPETGWEQTFLKQYTLFISKISQNIPVILSNDGSKVDLGEGVDYLKNNIGELFYYVNNEKNQGKGAALKAGARALNADFYLFTDNDFPYSIESMILVYNTLLNKKGIVMGVRDQSYYQDLSTFRTLLSKILKNFNKILLRLPSNDTQCGLKAFDHEAKEVLLGCETDRFLIDLEFLMAAQHQRILITPIPVILRDDISFTKFNSMVLFKELKNFLKLILKYRLGLK